VVSRFVIRLHDATDTIRLIPQDDLIVRPRWILAQTLIAKGHVLAIKFSLEGEFPICCFWSRGSHHGLPPLTALRESLDARRAPVSGGRERLDSNQVPDRLDGTNLGLAEYSEMAGSDRPFRFAMRSARAYEREI
jgi:hypothetical protein